MMETIYSKMTNDELKAKVIERAKKENVKFIRAQFVDINGTLKSTAVPADKLEGVLDQGIGFDGSSVLGYTPIHESDMILMPDPSTFAILPWRSSKDEKVARMICDVYFGNKRRFEGDPRYVAQRASKFAEDIGYKFNCGPELEFFLFQKDETGKAIPIDHGGYFDFHPLDLAEDVRRDMVNAMKQNFGIDVEMSHHEVAPGQYEVDFRFGDLVSTADKVITYKMVAKTVAHLHGYIASFMPKPIFGENGTGMHVHQSLWNIKENRNAFFDPEGKREDFLSDTALYFIGGLLNHAKALSAVLTPTVNSYKRLVPGYEAPVYISWAHKNRSALIRVPEYFPGIENATRAELRCPDPSCNPYLAFACMCAAGLDGIKNKTLPGEPIEENIFEMSPEEKKKQGITALHENLSDALDELESNKVIQKALGKHVYENFMLVKRQEWDEYRIQVTQWELDRYLKGA